MLQTLANLHRSCHTMFQCDAFITSREGITTWGMFRQAMRETFSRISACRASMIEIANTELDIEELDDNDDYRTEKRKAIHKVDLEWRLPVMRKKLDDKLGELGRFYAQAVGCYEQLLEENGSLSAEVQHALEQNFWVEKFTLEAALRQATGQPLTSDLYRHVLHLDDHQQVMRTLLNPSKLLQIAQNYKPRKPPLAGIPSIGMVRRLCGVTDIERISQGATVSEHATAGASL